MAKVTNGELTNIIQDGINVALTALCAKLEKGECSDKERKLFEEHLASSIAKAISEATQRGVEKS